MHTDCARRFNGVEYKRFSNSGTVTPKSPAWSRRNSQTPSVDIAKKIAAALGVSLDNLVGDTTVLVKDKKMICRLEVLQHVSPTQKDRILYMLDLMLKDAHSNQLSEKLA